MNDTKRATFMDMVRETLGNFLAYDSRFSNSFVPLLKNPGQLSLDYIAGERASHIHPMRLYLVTSFVLFFLTSISNWETRYSEAPRCSLPGEAADMENAPAYSTSGALEIDETTIKKARESHVNMFLLFFADIERNDTKNYTEAAARYNLEESKIDRFIFKKAFGYSTLSFDRFGTYLHKKVPIIAFIFLPFFVVFLNILHLKKDILYIEHLVFAFHVQSALFLMLIASTLVGLFYAKGEGVIGNAAFFLIFPAYLYLALKRFYGYPSHIKAILMFVVINFTYAIAALLTFVVGVLFTLILY